MSNFWQPLTSTELDESVLSALNFRIFNNNQSAMSPTHDDHGRILVDSRTADIGLNIVCIVMKRFSVLEQASSVCRVRM